MRQIGTIQTERDANRFGAFLQTLGIDNTIDPSAESWAVWVANDDHLEKASTELSTFQSAPTDRRYDDALPAAKTLLSTRQQAEDKRRENFVDVRTTSSRLRQWNAPVTFALIGISVVVGLMTHVWEEHRITEQPALINSLQIAPIVIVGDQYFSHRSSPRI